MKAFFVRNLEDWSGDARLYRVDPPIKFYDLNSGDEQETKFVVVSEVTGTRFGGPETYMFPARSNGEAINMMELPGSARGRISHEGVLSRAGYELAGTRCEICKRPLSPKDIEAGVDRCLGCADDLPVKM